MSRSATGRFIAPWLRVIFLLLRFLSDQGNTARMGLEDVQDGLDLKLAHGGMTGTVKVSPLLLIVLGFALVIVALAVPPHVADGLVNLIAMPNANVTDVDPETKEG